MLKPTVTIEQWGVVRSVISPIYDELQPGNHLTGHVFAHANLRRKTLVYTSPILSVDFSHGVVETLNTMYRLGEPSDEYKSWFNKRRVAAA
jgi:hypothetical protein